MTSKITKSAQGYIEQLVVRAFKAGLSMEQLRWVFQFTDEEVNRILREQLQRQHSERHH